MAYSRIRFEIQNSATMTLVQFVSTVQMQVLAEAGMWTRMI